MISSYVSVGVEHVPYYNAGPYTRIQIYALCQTSVATPAGTVSGALTLTFFVLVAYYRAEADIVNALLDCLVCMLGVMPTVRRIVFGVRSLRVTPKGHITSPEVNTRGFSWFERFSLAGSEVSGG